MLTTRIKNTPTKTHNRCNQPVKIKTALTIWTTCFLLLFALTGCQSEPTPVNSSGTLNQETVPATTKATKSYKSITDYSTEINGQHMKNSVLEIKRDGNLASLSIKIWLSPELREKMMDTESPVYFTFGDVMGSEKIAQLLVESPPVVPFDPSSTDGTYTLSQQIKLKEKLTSDEEKALFSPENYEFQLLNEEKLAVYTIIGLELSTIQQP